MRALVFVIALLVASLTGAQTQPRTWRLDFYETGGPGIEAFSFDRLVVEPLAWPDNPAANVDTRLTGNYRFEIVAGGSPCFSISMACCRAGDERSMNGSAGSMEYRHTSR
jgi:hypothetical protein